MQIGLFIGGAGPAPSVQSIVEQAQAAEAAGFSTFGMANIFSHDAMGALTLAGAQTERIELMTAVVPTYPRHPHAMAQQALTVQGRLRGGSRFVMGIGLSHKIVIEGMFGYSFDRPARHMKEYLDVLLPLLNGDPVQTDGEHYRGQVSLDIPRRRKARLLHVGRYGTRHAEARRRAHRRHHPLDDRRRSRRVLHRPNHQRRRRRSRPTAPPASS